MYLSDTGVQLTPALGRRAWGFFLLTMPLFSVWNALLELSHEVLNPLLILQ